MALASEAVEVIGRDGRLFAFAGRALETERSRGVAGPAHDLSSIGGDGDYARPWSAYEAARSGASPAG